MALGVSAQAAHERFSKGRSGSEVKAMVAKVPRSPKGTGNVDQSVFKSVLAIRLEMGESKTEAVEHATVAVRANSPKFVPQLPVGFCD
jgi:pyridoxal/pyridoxine/pyridoxamine kinase